MSEASYNIVNKEKMLYCHYFVSITLYSYTPKPRTVPFWNRNVLMTLGRLTLIKP